MLSTRLGISFLLLFAALGGCDDATDDAAKYDDERDACVARINAFRDTLDLPPLERWRDGERCADDEAKADSKTKRAHSAFGSCGERAQNECPGWGSLEQVISGCLQMMWDEGPESPIPNTGISSTCPILPTPVLLAGFTSQTTALFGPCKTLNNPPLFFASPSAHPIGEEHLANPH